jgi:hypothetical protein
VADFADVTFILVPQPDRRQPATRRTFWRGGRRASDMVAVAKDGVAKELLWTAAQDDRLADAKPHLH